jgi:hypothetical protein
LPGLQATADRIADVDGVAASQVHQSEAESAGRVASLPSTIKV